MKWLLVIIVLLFVIAALGLAFAPHFSNDQIALRKQADSNMTTATSSTASLNLTTATSVASSTAQASTTDLSPAWPTYNTTYYHYSIQYDPSWQVGVGPDDTTNFSLPSGSGAPFFSVAVNGVIGGVPAIAYYAVIHGQSLRPFPLASFSQVPDTCALRDDTHVYIQRDNVVYTISVGDVDGEFVTPPATEQALFERFAASFRFLEPWSDKTAPPVDPPIPVPCWD